MKIYAVGIIILGSAIAIGAVARLQAQSNGSFTGTVQRVWEDGFRLDADGRTVRVDTWDVCGDATASYVKVSDRLTVEGEFEGGEFDAFSLTNDAGESLCQ